MGLILPARQVQTMGGVLALYSKTAAWTNELIRREVRPRLLDVGMALHVGAFNCS